MPRSEIRPSSIASSTGPSTTCTGSKCRASPYGKDVAAKTGRRHKPALPGRFLPCAERGKGGKPHPPPPHPTPWLNSKKIGGCRSLLHDKNSSASLRSDGGWHPSESPPAGMASIRGELVAARF